MTVLEFLEKNQSEYQVTCHKPAYTSEQLARMEHVPPRQIAKPVVVDVDGRYYLCVLPADRKIDLNTLQKCLNAKAVQLADERKMKKLFADSELGAEAPIGALYDMPTLMDKSLEKDREILFQAESHETTVHMTMIEYLRLAKPTILKFSYPVHHREQGQFFYDPYIDDPFII